MSDQRYAADIKKGLVFEGGGMAGTLRAFWPDELGGEPRVPAAPGTCSCGGYSQQSYGGVLVCLGCAIARRAAGGNR